MTPQEVIKTFMRALDTHGYTMNIQDSSDYNQTNQQKIKEKIMNQAIAKSSPYQTIQEVIDEIAVVCKRYNAEDPENGWDTFLKDKCGIDLSNIDTGAITGSDANIVIDGETIGSGIEKDYNAALPEYGNYYEPLSNSPQYITTGDNGWIIQTKSGNDTIISNGEDIIIPGTGASKIEIYGSRATIDCSNGNNHISISDNTTSVSLFNYTSESNIIDGNTDAVIFEEDNTKLGYITPVDNPIISLINSNIKNNDTDNYFNRDGVDIYTGTDTITIDLSKAIIPSAPSIVGGFIIDNSTGNSAKFVSTNSEARTGKIVGHVASVYTHVMMWTVKNLTIRISDRILINGTTTQKLAEFDSFDDVGNDSSVTFKNTFKNGQTVSEFTDTDTNNEYERYVVASLYKWWVKEALKASWEAYGYSFEDPDTTILFMDTHFDKTVGGIGAYASVSYNIYNTGATASLDLNIHKEYCESLTKFEDDNGVGSWYLDRTIVHEFVHGVMAAKTSFFICLPLFISEGIAELIHGIDDKRTSSIIALAKNAGDLEYSIHMKINSTTADYAYAGGYIFLRYFAKQTALKTQDALVPMQITPIVNLTSSGNDATYYVNNSTANPESTTIQDALVPTQITPIVNLTSSGNDDIYHVNNDTVNLEATTTQGIYVVGKSDSNIYTPSDNFEEIINIKSGTWTVDLSQPNNIVNSYCGNTTVHINGGDNQTVNLESGGNGCIHVGFSNANIITNNHKITLGEGTNTVKFFTGENHSLISNNGNNDISFDSLSLSDYKVTLSGGNNTAIIRGYNHKVEITSGDNTLKVNGSNDSIIFGSGNDSLFQFTNSDGGNYYQFNSGLEIGKNKIIGFKSNDKLIFAEEHNIIYGDIESTIPENSSFPIQYCTITVKSGNDDLLGTVYIETNVENETFDKTQNVRLEKALNDTPTNNILYYPEKNSKKDIFTVNFKTKVFYYPDKDNSTSSEEIFKLQFKTKQGYDKDILITDFLIKNLYYPESDNIAVQKDIFTLNFTTINVYELDSLLEVNFKIEGDKSNPESSPSNTNSSNPPFNSSGGGSSGNPTPIQPINPDLMTEVQIFNTCAVCFLPFDGSVSYSKFGSSWVSSAGNILRSPTIASTTQFGKSEFKKALHLTTPRTIIEMPTLPYLCGQDMTVSFWFCVSSKNKLYRLGMLRMDDRETGTIDSDSDHYLSMFWDSNFGFYCVIDQDHTYGQQHGYTVSLDKWHNVILYYTHNSQKWSFYIDNNHIFSKYKNMNRIKTNIEVGNITSLSGVTIDFYIKNFYILDGYSGEINDIDSSTIINLFTPTIGDGDTDYTIKYNDLDDFEYKNSRIFNIFDNKSYL